LLQRAIDHFTIASDAEAGEFLERCLAKVDLVMPEADIGRHLAVEALVVLLDGYLARHVQKPRHGFAALPSDKSIATEVFSSQRPSCLPAEIADRTKPAMAAHAAFR
jgi:hypothetical protein